MDLPRQRWTTNVHEGIKSFKDIVEGIVDAKEAWDFVARTSTQGG